MSLIQDRSDSVPFVDGASIVSYVASYWCTRARKSSVAFVADMLR